MAIGAAKDCRSHRKLLLRNFRDGIGKKKHQQLPDSTKKSEFLKKIQQKLESSI